LARPGRLTSLWLAPQSLAENNKFMENPLKVIEGKINGFIWTLAINGVVLLLLGVLIVWTDFMLRLVMGVLVIVVAYVFFYSAYKVWSFKKDLEKYLKFLK